MHIIITLRSKTHEVAYSTALVQCHEYMYAYHAATACGPRTHLRDTQPASYPTATYTVDITTNTHLIKPFVRARAHAPRPLKRLTQMKPE